MSPRRWIFIIGSVVVAAFVAASCASSGPAPSGSPSSKGDGGWTTVHQLYLPTLRFRRPVGAPADPRVGPGGVDYKSDPLPGSKLDCVSQQEFLSRIDFKAVQACLYNETQVKRVIYRLQKTDHPSLVLNEDKENPACLTQVLNEIPIPREIFFESYELDGSLGCYASGIRSEAERPIPLKWVQNRGWELEVDFPLIDDPKPPKDEAAARRIILSWILRPFLSDSGKEVVAKPVPESLCRVCLGSALPKTGERRAVSPQNVDLWPTDE